MTTTPTLIPAELVCALREVRHLVVLTGAGVSAESGMPTFRDALTGLWVNFDAEELATPNAFQAKPDLVWGWYEWRRMKALQAQPNPAHLALAALAARVPKLSLITQNVDDLHERAGSHEVLHLHGSLHAPYCATCGHPHNFALGTPDEPEGGRLLSPPICPKCGGRVRPGVVCFGEAMPKRELARAFKWAQECDLLIVIGTSGLVHPAAQIPQVAREAGAMVVQINSLPSSLDKVCHHSLRGAAGVVLPAWLAELDSDQG